MADSTTTASYADIAAGFIERFGVFGPLVEFAASNIKLTVLIKLKKPDKKIFIDLGATPMKIEVDGPQERADVVLTSDADIFHYILWGKYLFNTAMNDRLILLEIKTGALPEVPMLGSTKKKKDKAPGTNKLYEAYLINIGAGHLLDDLEGLSIPPDPGREVKSIELKPTRGEGLLAKAARVAAYVTGLAGGILLRLVLKRYKIRRPGIPKKIEYLTFDEVFSPPPPPAPARRGLGFAAMKFLFSRVDIFTILGSMVKGAETSGAFKEPLEMPEPMLKAQV